MTLRLRTALAAIAAAGIVGPAVAPAMAQDAGPPDLSGTWDNGGGIPFVQPVQTGANVCLFGCDAPEGGIAAATARPLPPERPSYKPEYAATVEDLDTRQVEEDPVLRCMPPGVPRIGPPDKVVQTPTEVVFLYEDVSGPFFRVIPIDGRGHREDIGETALGDSIGWWENDTLVVETINLTDDTWLTDDGAFHTGDLRVVERLRLVDDQLEWTATSEDPEVLAEPWTLRPRLAERADWEITVSPPCVERDLEHMADMTSHDNPR